MESVWAGAGEGLAAEVAAHSESCLGAYQKQPLRVEEDANIEMSVAEADYDGKQLYEFVQNSADALLGHEGRIHVTLTADCLYVANEGAPLTAAGLEALMGSHLSRKRDEQIGRFGLGFKSVVGISDRPQFISRSGSFGFDRERAKARIQTVVPEAPAFPMLRLAEPLDPIRLAEQDAVLAALMEWAVTVLRVPLVAGRSELAMALQSFPAEFLLFSAQVKELVLEDVVAQTRREIRISKADDQVLTLEDEGDHSDWRVASVKHFPSSEAAEDAGTLAHRESVVISWAVPLTGGRARTRVGSFWAFFPTEDQTTLAGIVNAPWKLTTNRRQLVEGRFNQELLTEVLPKLIAQEWPHLLDDADPAGILEVLPARGRESRSWGDQVLNQPVFTTLGSHACLPDVQGVLRRPVDLKIHPVGLGAEVLEMWAALEPAPAGWVHHGVERNDELRLKADRLIGDSTSSRPDVADWIEALCRGDDVASSAVAISVVDALVRSGGQLAREARSAKVVLLEDGTHAAAVPGRVFVRSSEQDEGYNFIHSDLARLPSVKECLARLGIEVLDRAGELRNLLSGRRPNDVDWGKAWSLARQCTQTVAAKVFKEELAGPLEAVLRVRSMAGRWTPLGSVFLPGGVVAAGDTENSAFCIDTSFHRSDLELLTAVGAVGQPVLRHGIPEELWLRAYKDWAQDLFINEARGSKPQVDKLEVYGAPVPWPLEPLSSLSPSARVALTTVALGLTSGEPWTVRHQTNASYGEQKYTNPVHWWVFRHGLFQTGVGPMRPLDCLQPSDDLPEDALPVVDVSTVVGKLLQVKRHPEELRPETWQQMLRRAEGWHDARRASRLYSWASWYVAVPQRIAAQVGARVALVPPGEVAVVRSEETFRSLAEQQIPALLVEEEADFQRLQDAWGLEDGNKQLEQELVYQPAGEPESLVFRFPHLKMWLEPDQHDVAFQFCDDINLVTATRAGQKSRPVPHALDNDRVLVTSTEPQRILAAASDVLHLQLSPADIHSILDAVREEAIEKLIAEVRNADSDEERLALLVGEEALRRGLPVAALESLEDELGRSMDAVELAGLVKAVHGVGALQHFRAVLEEKGLNPPRQWAGLTSARRWVTDLGFSPEFAGFSSQVRPASFVVDGPADLPPLHDYQEACTAGIKRLLAGEGPARGLVSLPTGAGKTRVAVQALVEEVREGKLGGPIVWIAQSDELCEQAVETWAFIWRAVGPRAPMAVGRLWGSNEVDEAPESFQLVVATPDTLRNKVGVEAYQWLTAATVVLVDEAHSSVAPTYTAVLEWLGRRARTRRDDRPLIGLTATPFRSFNKDETDRLVKRYDGNRLDEGAFDGEPYPILQATGVLARVKQQILKGADVSFSATEAQEVDQFGRLPKSVENALGGNVLRNRTIVDAVASLPEDWTSLLFATSVENARALAAQLSYRGIPAVAIAGDTDVSARRWYIEEFKAGRIRVITNYNVLTQGFDAPAVKAVFVTRPTFSPNVYQQMIGRGLRGPLNGGSEEVLIVNVEDNFHQYGDRLAFTDFEYLWKQDE